MRKPSKLEITAREMVEVFSKKTDLEELKEEIKAHAIAMSPYFSAMIVLIKKEKDGYYPTIYLSKKDLKRKYPG